MGYIRTLDGKVDKHLRIKTRVLDITFDISHGVVGLRSRLEKLAEEARKAVSDEYSILVLSDEKAGFDRAPHPQFTRASVSGKQPQRDRTATQRLHRGALR